jgi:D-xylose transport system substrate-binding protein
MIVDGLKKAGKDPKTAKVVFMGGDPTDGNAKFFHDGAAKVMSDAGIKPAFEPKGTWDADKSGTNFEQAYTALKGNVDAVWVANDANAASVIAILDKNGKKVPVSGQDASIAGLQNILLGKQTATVYKPFQLEADQAGKLAVDLLNGKKPTAPEESNGVPFFNETPILTDAAGIQKVIDDGNATAADICKGDVKAACDKAGIK